jgi:hypothetical protein
LLKLAGYPGSIPYARRAGEGEGLGASDAQLGAPNRRAIFERSMKWSMGNTSSEMGRMYKRDREGRPQNFGLTHRDSVRLPQGETYAKVINRPLPLLCGKRRFVAGYIRQNCDETVESRRHAGSRFSPDHAMF